MPCEVEVEEREVEEGVMKAGVWKEREREEIGARERRERGV